MLIYRINNPTRKSYLCWMAFPCKSRLPFSRHHCITIAKRRKYDLTGKTLGVIRWYNNNNYNTPGRKEKHQVISIMNKRNLVTMLCVFFNSVNHDTPDFASMSPLSLYRMVSIQYSYDGNLLVLYSKLRSSFPAWLYTAETENISSRTY